MKLSKLSINISLTLFIIFSLFNANVAGQITNYTVKDVPNVHLIDSTQYVSDPENIIPQDKKDSINYRIQTLRDSGLIEIAVVVLPSIDKDRYSIAKSFAFSLFNKWGIGDKDSDNGLLILLITDLDDREIVFETGYGIEGFLPDALCKRIQVKKMIPLMKELDYGGGLLAGVNEIGDILEGNSELIAKSEKEDKVYLYILLIGWLVFGLIWFWILGLETNKKNKKASENYMDAKLSYRYGCVAPVLFLPSFLIILLIREKLKKQKTSVICEKCKEMGGVVFVSSNIIKKATPSEKGEKRYNFVCKKCGHKHSETKSYSWNTPYDHGSGSSRSSSSGRSYSGGGSSRGGSWGGGRSGGGGASTKF